MNQTAFETVENQFKNGKYNLILVNSTKIPSLFLRVYQADKPLQNVSCNHRKWTHFYRCFEGDSKDILVYVTRIVNARGSQCPI